MKKKRILAMILAVASCLSLAVGASAAKVVLPICFSLRFGGAYFFSDETVVCIVSPFLIV